MRAAVLMLMAVSACNSSARECPLDENVHYTPSLSRADVCSANGYRVILRFTEARSKDQVATYISRVEGSFACDDPASGVSNCWIVELGDGLCCSDAVNELTSQQVSVDVPHPDTPCSCDTIWTAE